MMRRTCSCRVYTWGWNKYGQLGSGTVENASMPAPVRTLTQKVTQVCIHSCGLVPEGALTLPLQLPCHCCAQLSALQRSCCCQGRAFPSMLHWQHSMLACNLSAASVPSAMHCSAPAATARRISKHSCPCGSWICSGHPPVSDA